MSNSLPSDFVFLKETFDKIGERNNREDFNPLRVINRQTNEVTHSDILAYILKNDLRGISGLKNFLKRLVDLEIINSFQDFSDASVKREWENIDIFIDIEELGLAIGIENKLFSGERERQLEDYQKVLKEKFRGRKRILLFLTPNGRAPETADVDHEIPCYSISYQDILEVIDREDAIGSYGDFLRMFKNHLEVNIIMDEELKTEIRKFWGNPEYREKLQYLNSYRPMITEIKEPYEYKVNKYLRENYNDEAKLSLEPNNSPKEIKIRSKRLENLDVDICYMLYDKLKGCPPAFRVLVPSNHYKEQINLYREIKEILKEKNLNLAFEKVPKWDFWTGVLKSSEPDFVFDEPHDYSDKFAQWAFEIFKENYEKVNGVLMNNIDRIKRVQKEEKSD